MFNPCKKCLVKGNCSTECKEYKTFQDNSARITAISTFFITALILLVCIIIDAKLPLVFWSISFLSTVVIPKISFKFNIFIHILLAPYILITTILALSLRKFVMRPIDFSKEKKKKFFKRMIDIAF